MRTKIGPAFLKGMQDMHYRYRIDIKVAGASRVMTQLLVPYDPAPRPTLRRLRQIPTTSVLPRIFNWSILLFHCLPRHSAFCGPRSGFNRFHIVGGGVDCCT